MAEMRHSTAAVLVSLAAEPGLTYAGMEIPKSALRVRNIALRCKSC